MDNRWEITTVPGSRSFPEKIVCPIDKAEMVQVSTKQTYVRRGDMVLVRPRILGYLQSHVVLRRELNSVFSALFTPSHGVGITIREIETYRESPGEALSFAALEERAARRGEVALGLLFGKDDSEYEVDICPARTTECAGNACVVVLSRRA